MPRALTLAPRTLPWWPQPWAEPGCGGLVPCGPGRPRQWWPWTRQRGAAESGPRLLSVRPCRQTGCALEPGLSLGGEARGWVFQALGPPHWTGLDFGPGVAQPAGLSPGPRVHQPGVPTCLPAAGLHLPPQDRGGTEARPCPRSPGLWLRVGRPQLSSVLSVGAGRASGQPWTRAWVLLLRGHLCGLASAQGLARSGLGCGKGVLETLGVSPREGTRAGWGQEAGGWPGCHGGAGVLKDQLSVDLTAHGVGAVSAPSQPRAQDSRRGRRLSVTRPRGGERPP